MTLLVPNDGEVVMLKAMFNHTSPEDQLLKLFKNDITPNKSHIASDFTEADFAGYSAVALTGSSWSVVAGSPSTASYSEQSFTSSAGSQNQDIYGYYVVQASSGKILFAERFPAAPYNIADNADQIRVTPSFTLS